MKIAGLLVAVVAAGVIGFVVGRWTGDGAASPGTTALSPRLQAPRAAAANGADIGFTGSCGVERHDVKDLLDGFVPGASRDISVAELRALPVPANADAGRTRPERVVYRIQALALADKIEADSDIHLALADPADPSATLIAEFPAASCLAESTEAPELEAARADLVGALGDPPTSSKYHNLTPPPCVTLTGVAFFDRIHGQRGVAPNGIELHPVLTFQAGCEVPSPPPTTTSTLPETTPEPPDTTPVTTVPLTVSSGRGCDRYPGRHWYRHTYHQDCKSYYFTTP
jgi:hypothetical protein